MANVKYAILNSSDTNTNDPKYGISMVLSDSAEEALFARMKRFRESDEYDPERGIYFSDEQEIELSDGMILAKRHIYYYKNKDSVEETHDVISAWPVYVD